jgi:hypothetical protein
MSYLPKSEKIIVVEISPFLNCTGPALFKWDKDGEIMRNGPFEFRLNSFVRPHLDEIVETNWKLRWTQKVPPYREFYDKAKPDESGNCIFVKIRMCPEEWGVRIPPSFVCARLLFLSVTAF